jgi:hypothetical protein
VVAPRFLLRLATVAAITICVAALAQAQTPALSSNDQAIAKAFENRAKEYVKLREQLEEKMPKLSQETGRLVEREARIRHRDVEDRILSSPAVFIRSRARSTTLVSASCLVGSLSTFA